MAGDENDLDVSPELARKMAEQDWPDGLTMDDIRVRSDCTRCARRWLGTTGCEAYPPEEGGIPLPIITGEEHHRVPRHGDHGLTFLQGKPYFPER